MEEGSECTRGADSSSLGSAQAVHPSLHLGKPEEPEVPQVPEVPKVPKVPEVLVIPI